jgi:hypothetical protein
MVKSLHSAWAAAVVFLLTASLGSQNKMRNITVDRMSFAYEDTGSGPPVILVHGSIADYRGRSNQQGDGRLARQPCVFKKRTGKL